MKIFNKDNIYDLVPKVNIVLALCAVLLAIYLIFNLTHPYRIDRKLKMQPLEIMNRNQAVILAEGAVFKEDLFKAKSLFNQSGLKKTAESRKEFILLGVSVGDKNLAVLKDTRGNKDYYCAEGDMIGDYRVKQIFKDKVILESGGNILEINR
jgi:type II secretory pathway component PulC